MRPGYPSLGLFPYAAVYLKHKLSSACELYIELKRKTSQPENSSRSREDWLEASPASNVVKKNVTQSLGRLKSAFWHVQNSRWQTLILCRFLGGLLNVLVD